MHGSLAKHMAKTELNVNRLTATLFSNFGARLQQPTANYKCNQGHGWIAHNHMYKTSMLKYLKISMDLSVASCLHGIKIIAEQVLQSATASTLLSKLDALRTQITKIHG